MLLVLNNILIGKVCVWGRNALFMWPIYLDIGPQQRIACKKKKKIQMI